MASQAELEAEEKKLAFEILSENSGSLASTDKIYQYLCALGLTPNKKVIDELPASADLNTAMGLYDKYAAELKPLEKEQIAQWFKTWDGNDLGEIKMSVLKGEMEDGVDPLTDQELDALKSMAKVNGDMLQYASLVEQMFEDQKMKTGTC
eukprot:TRINITY_DN3870_c0_g1_i2.p1 TRINITY_DN3870_c0_g1~~TRINITY_DN3870_c0_g1_i2.p1  ORF type:complete len:150 (+),score=67.85 TRINITY_DN3870_c0_g1_i2:148-597(+)